MTKAERQAEKLSRKMQSGGLPHLGSIVMWTLTGVKVSRKKLEELYEAHGLDESWLPTEIEGSVAFRKALREAGSNNSGIMIRNIDENPEYIKVGIVREKVDKDAEDLYYGVECKLQYSKDAETISTNNKEHPLAIQVFEAYQDLRDHYVTRDFTRLLARNIAKMDSVVLRSSGGVYFVPVTHNEVLLKHRAVLKALEAEFTVLPVYGDNLTREDLGAQTKRSLEEEIKGIKGDIEAFKANAPRRDTMRRRLEEFKELRSKAKMYAQLLAIQVQDIEEGLTDCEVAMGKLLGAEEKRFEKRPKRSKKSEPVEGARIIKKIGRRPPVTHVGVEKKEVVVRKKKRVKVSS